VVAALLVAGNAHAEKLANYVFGAGGVTSDGEGKHHLSAIIGMAVGRSSNGTHTVYHGYLAGAGNRDEEPPVIAELGNITVPTGANNCAGVVNFPAVRVTDNRDPNPTVTVTLQTDPARQLNVAGERVELPLGSYDVLVVAIDRYDNESRASYRVDVVDRTPPVIQTPNPTPAGEEAEATSPVGTQVAGVNFACEDACTDAPRAALDPVLARYPLGDTQLSYTCRDAAGNESASQTTIRVRDTTPPTLIGQRPGALDAECQDRRGATIDVPGIAFQDNGTARDELELRLVVNPGEDQQAYDDVPEQIQLIRGEHTLRYVVTDSSGNSSQVDVDVVVADNSVPEIEVIRAPDSGWHGGDDPLIVTLRVQDGCNDEELDVDVGGARPDDISRDGNEITLTFNRDGVYELSISVTDDDGNEVTDDSIAFGIDRTPPDVVLNRPDQRGTRPGDEATYATYAWAELVAIAAGGEDAADGVNSGIRQVLVTLDPGSEDERVLADRTLRGQGTPPTGARAVADVACENRRGALGQVDGVCNADGGMELRAVKRGVHTVDVAVTDFAGNTSTARGYFIVHDLHGGAELLRDRIAELIAEGVPDAVGQRLNIARAQLGVALDLTDADFTIEGSPHDTPRHLGAAFQAVQTAVLRLKSALELAAGGQRSRIRTFLDYAVRVSSSDLELMQAFTESMVRDESAGFLIEAMATDDRIVGQALEGISGDLEAGNHTAAMGNALLGFFHAKSAHVQWMMDYDYTPSPGAPDNVKAEYGRAADLLDEMIVDVQDYLSIGEPPGRQFMNRFLQRLQGVTNALHEVADAGFRDQADRGLTDNAYMEALFDMIDASNFATTAGNQGAWVRNYQWSMMQVVRYMTSASVHDAMFFNGGGRGVWPLYTQSMDHINNGIDLIEQRRIQALLDLYGGTDEVRCLMVGVYHCDFLNDEARDEDPPWDLDRTPAVCWETMWRPAEWADVENRFRPAECQWGDEVSDAR
jgi:hypothetical protein